MSFFFNSIRKSTRLATKLDGTTAKAPDASDTSSGSYNISLEEIRDELQSSDIDPPSGHSSDSDPEIFADVEQNPTDVTMASSATACTKPGCEQKVEKYNGTGYESWRYLVELALGRAKLKTLLYETEDEKKYVDLPPQRRVTEMPEYDSKERRHRKTCEQRLEQISPESASQTRKLNDGAGQSKVARNRRTIKKWSTNQLT